ncbi:MAG: phosphoribosylformylglycinamidine synthase I, partial [Candidatus Magasanikbacteria bacterium]|nr:phosphoribosylformylglycinamidine synthase I [Candidatus Magasanikbacteria bacterium]
MKIAIIQFPGSNCETESLQAIRAVGMEAEEFLWNDDHRKLEKYDGYFIVGGFSYEDRSRSGIIASLDPVMAVVKNEAGKGKPALGVCNGAQILVETGLIPGLKNNALGMALSANKRVRGGKVLGTGYYNAWAHIGLNTPPEQSAFTKNLPPSTILHLPVAHGEGRFLMAPALLDQLRSRQLITFRYCDAAGVIDPEFPINPNGSLDNIAAVGNSSGNILAIMPHPERSPDCQALFTSMRDYIAAPTKTTSTPLTYTPPRNQLTRYHPKKNTVSLVVGLIITDNEEKTVSQTL